MLTSIIVLIAAFIYYNFLDSLPSAIITITQYAPYVIFSFGMIMAIQFNRSRIFFILLTLFIAKIAINPIWVNDSVFTYICFFTSINVLVFSILKERGYLTVWGLIRFFFIFIQASFLIWLYFRGYSETVTKLNADLFPWNMLSPIPDYGILLFLFVLAILILRGYLYKSFLEPFLVGVMVSSFISLNFYNNNLLSSVFFSCGGIILITAIIKLTYNMSYLDELTGLPARRALREDMLKLSGNYVIAMLDIDFFKKFNDKHGHDIGDEVLKMVAATIKEVNGRGKAYRYGGEEFTILFPNKDLTEAIPFLEEVRERVAKRGFIVRSKNRPRKKPEKIVKNKITTKKLHVTISIGGAEKTKELRTPQEVLKMADKALYRAKKKGRNCVSK
ncbi:GGDEF domain-containing protein [Alkaliphilus pronyensis]|nr:GGDEF domain-containing protein [Alkaliphilus pronyensis]